MLDIISADMYIIYITYIIYIIYVHIRYYMYFPIVDIYIYVVDIYRYLEFCWASKATPQFHVKAARQRHHMLNCRHRSPVRTGQSPQAFAHSASKVSPRLQAATDGNRWNRPKGRLMFPNGIAMKSWGESEKMVANCQKNNGSL